MSISAVPAAHAVGTPGIANGSGAIRPVYLDASGVVRWRGSNAEVTLFGANYCIMSGSDYRMSGLVASDRKAMIDEDMAHFARMGWNGLRLCSWGDWENSDRDGNLVNNEHVDLLDYLIARARERGIYILLTPIHTYNPAFADQVNVPTQNVGFSRYFERPEMGTNPRSIAAQARYIGQLLGHVNPYTGVALKDEPAILFVEMINEPVHHPEDAAGSVRYIDTLVDAVRRTGSKQLTFFNVSQDFAIATAIQKSKVDGVSFGWYPTSLVAGHALEGNFLRAVDAYPDMLRPELKGRPRIVYEFDQADLLSGYLYPAMARTFRSVGTQFAAMFAYDMLRTAPYNLGWQTHYLNLVHTPKKALSAVIAAEAMRRLPRMRGYGSYPDNVHFGDFRVSYPDDMSELNAADAFMNAGSTRTMPRSPKTLTRIAGVGSSPLVSYEGTGAYFLDKLRDGLWRLELYPDEVLIADPFEQPQPGKVVSRLLYRRWPMEVHLPDLGAAYSAEPLNVPGGRAGGAGKAVAGRFEAEPGVWLLSRGAVDRASLPARVGALGLDEYHVNAPADYADFAQSLAPKEFIEGTPMEIPVRVANTVLADEVELWVRPAGVRSFGKPLVMQRRQGNDYSAVIEAGALRAGLYEFAVSTSTSGRVTTFPGAVPQRPGEWPFRAVSLWSFRITPEGSPVRLLDPKNDFPHLSFVRPGEQYRMAFFEIAPGESADESALSLGVPDLGKDTPERYAASLYIGAAIAPRRASISGLTQLTVKLRAVGGAHKTVLVSLIEQDGATWSATIGAGSAWSTVAVPVADLRLSRSIHIPSPFPGLWNYWRESPPGRAGDRIHLDAVERLELRVTPNGGTNSADDAAAVAVESIRLESPAAGASAGASARAAGAT